jgi:hypothetical protein
MPTTGYNVVAFVHDEIVIELPYATRDINVPIDDDECNDADEDARDQGERVVVVRVLAHSTSSCVAFGDADVWRARCAHMAHEAAMVREIVVSAMQRVCVGVPVSCSLALSRRWSKRLTHATSHGVLVPCDVGL